MKEYELSTYKVISSEVKAIKYDGTDEMEDWIDSQCSASYVEYDEGGRRGLRCPKNIECDSFRYVYDGDYLVNFNGIFVVMDEEEFNSKYFFYYA